MACATPLIGGALQYGVTRWGSGWRSWTLLIAAALAALVVGLLWFVGAVLLGLAGINKR